MYILARLREGIKFISIAHLSHAVIIVKLHKTKPSAILPFSLESSTIYPKILVLTMLLDIKMPWLNFTVFASLSMKNCSPNYYVHCIALSGSIAIMPTFTLKE